MPKKKPITRYTLITQGLEIFLKIKEVLVMALSLVFLVANLLLAYQLSPLKEDIRKLADQIQVQAKDIQDIKDVSVRKDVQEQINKRMEEKIDLLLGRFNLTYKEDR